MNNGLEKISSLTGLRFVAAFCVVFSHMLPKVVPLSSTHPAWYLYLESISAEGMTLFFVLSGFVIQYNYSNCVRTGLRGIYNFLVARFARLYPLYLVVIGYQLLLDYAYQNQSTATSSALPFYLTLTQTWFFLPIGKYGIVSELGILPSVAWSISTEWFFYLCYPIVAFLLNRISSIKTQLLFAFAIASITISTVLIASHSAPALNQFGTAWVGSISDTSQFNEYSLFRWLTYLSPYLRVSEFLTGCICASIFMKLRHKQPSAIESHLGNMALTGALLGLVLFHWLFFGYNNGSSAIHDLHRVYGFAPFMAVIIYCCARYDSPIKRALSSWQIVLCGEASYSLYLWHMFIIYAVRWESAAANTFIIGLADSFRMLIAMMSAIGLSIVSWRLIEVPARNWLRKLLSLKQTIKAYDQIPDSAPLKGLAQSLKES